MLPANKNELPKDAEKSRTQVVHEALRMAILEQRIRPGERLPEDTIGQAFGTSRTIAREALGRLIAEGLVEQKHHRGAFVTIPSLEEAKDLLEVRMGLERTVIYSLVGKIKTEDKKYLRNFIEDEQNSSYLGNKIRPVRLSGDFHIELAKITKNKLLEKYITQLVSRGSLIISAYGCPHSSECSAKEHQEILEALEDKDFDLAAERMRLHLEAMAKRSLFSNKNESLKWVLTECAVDYLNNFINYTGKKDKK